MPVKTHLNPPEPVDMDERGHLNRKLRFRMLFRSGNRRFLFDSPLPLFRQRQHCHMKSAFQNAAAPAGEMAVKREFLLNHQSVKRDFVAVSFSILGFFANGQRSRYGRFLEKSTVFV